MLIFKFEFKQHLWMDLGCDQYHFDNDDTEGAPTSVGTVQSFNFNNGDGRHLANQDQTICIRREAGKILKTLSSLIKILWQLSKS